MSRPSFPSFRSRPVAAHLAGASVVLAMLVVGTVTVFAEVPTAGFIVTPDPPVAGESATFVASANDPDGLEIVKYEWDFEGGGYVDGGASQPHTFATAGPKSVKLRVTDAATEVTEVTQAVTVDDPPPPPPTPPSNLTPPTVSGTPVDGGTLTSTNGVWNGTEPITFTRQWQRCQSIFCSDIPGATVRATRRRRGRRPNHSRRRDRGQRGSGQRQRTERRDRRRGRERAGQDAPSPKWMEPLRKVRR